MKFTAEEISQMLDSVAGDATWGLLSTEEKVRRLTILINDRLQEMLKDAPVFFLEDCEPGSGNWIQADRGDVPGTDATHTARLVCIEEIKK